MKDSTKFNSGISQLDAMVQDFWVAYNVICNECRHAVSERVVVGVRLPFFLVVLIFHAGIDSTLSYPNDDEDRRGKVDLVVCTSYLFYTHDHYIHQINGTITRPRHAIFQ